ncbi:MAG: Methyl-accepting chemotaxis protein [uncultured Sulfurovum sp.]|uniref:histidine kinase n=1 Tax=uncultured Sulfurovum sp. TaxID=269237 RepID=A0A6S6U5C7_9BACT|nr:MAG: Methyl-accepting chemotaxis protein [uncultured Sulfurovum sp.]
MNFLKNKSITSIHIIAMVIMFIFALLFTTLVIYKKYNDFEKNANTLRKTYISKQKETVKFDINRVLKYINYEYSKNNTLVSEEELKAKVIDSIEQLYGREDGTGYIFIYDFSGVKISDPIWSYDIGQNTYNIEDANGIKVIEQLIKIAKNHSDAFLQYTWRKPKANKGSLKLSHAMAFEPWGWMLGTGIYLDEVEKLIDKDRIILQERLKNYLIEIAILIMVLFFIGAMVIIVINRVISQEIDTFSNFFKKASKSHITISEDTISLNRLKNMVQYINDMVSEIHKQKEKLEEMNVSLEQKVTQKTKDLNYLLEKQDSFIRHSIHEINTPLAVIMTHLDIFKMKFGENKYLSKIEAGSKMIANIYDDLGYMVKKDRFIYEKENLDFSQFLRSRIDFFEEIALGNKRKIIMKIEDAILLIFNEMELQRIIDNNLSNSIKYAKKNSNIVVILEKTSNDIVLKFATNSSKIEDTKSIFEAFYRKDLAESGFGLGLEIVASICKKNLVMVEVESDIDTTVFSYIFKG